MHFLHVYFFNNHCLVVQNLCVQRVQTCFFFLLLSIVVSAQTLDQIDQLRYASL